MDLRYAKRSEETEQIELMQWAQRAQDRYPELMLLHHIPNGGSRNKAEAVKLKQMGVKSGVSDLSLPYPSGCYHGMYIELKYGNNTLTREQLKFLTNMKDLSYFVCVCYSFSTAREIIEKYLNLTENEMLMLVNGQIDSGKVKYTDNGVPIIKPFDS